MDKPVRWLGARWYWFSHRPVCDFAYRCWRAPEFGARMAVMEPAATEYPDWTQTLQERPAMRDGFWLLLCAAIISALLVDSATDHPTAPAVAHCLQECQP